jgi:hypothetical protein
MHSKTIRIAAQLNVSKRGASKGATRTIRRFTAQYVRLGCARPGDYSPPFHQRPTLLSSGAGPSAAGRATVYWRPDTLVWLRLRDMFLPPNEGGRIRLFALKTSKRGKSQRSLEAVSESHRLGIKSARPASIRKTTRCRHARSRRLQPLKEASSSASMQHGLRRRRVARPQSMGT